jgi:hypothetical protein
MENYGKAIERWLKLMENYGKAIENYILNSIDMEKPWKPTMK